MSAIILPSSTVSSKPKQQKAYPFKAKRYGSGPMSSDMNRPQLPQQPSPPIGGKIPYPKQGYGSEFWAKRVQSTPQSGSGSEFWTNRCAQPSGKGVGRGYFGPGGWVNTQPVEARRELSEAERRGAEVRNTAGRQNTGRLIHKPLSRRQYQSEAEKLSFKDKNKNATHSRVRKPRRDGASSVMAAMLAKMLRKR